MELYLHIPFCVRKCAYCDFLSFAAGGGQQEQYVRQLCREIQAKSAAFADREVSALFIGGGTPSILKEGLVGRIMDAVREHFSLSRGAEATIEANPGTLTEEKLREYKSAGLNRISLGLQSANDRELRLLGRIHTFGQFLESFHLAREAGFQNINVDLMSAIPGQTAASWEDTLGRVIALGPEHISAYSLIIEEGTPFYERYGDAAPGEESSSCGLSVGKESSSCGLPVGKENPSSRLSSGEQLPSLPDEDEERLMYRRTGELLAAAGYERYEISNYARPGFWCRHNAGYWTGEEYLGLGLGASSFACGWRFSNTRDMGRYMTAGGEDMAQPSFYEETEKVTEQAAMEEFMFLGLRMTRGVSEAEFLRKFCRSMREVYGPVLENMRRLGLMESAGGRWRLTERGLDVSNRVMAEFLL